MQERGEREQANLTPELPVPAPSAPSPASVPGMSNAAFAAFAAFARAGRADRSVARGRPADAADPGRADDGLTSGLANVASRRRERGAALARQPAKTPASGTRDPSSARGGGAGKGPEVTIGPEIWYHRIESRARPVTNIPGAERTNTADAIKVYKDDTLVVGVSIRDLPADREPYFPIIAASGMDMVEFGESKETSSGWEWRVRFRTLGSTQVEAYVNQPTGPTNWKKTITIHGDLVDYKAALDRTSDLVSADILEAGANVNDASSAYKAAFDKQKSVLDKEAKNRKMVEELLWNALFAGLGGLVGGGIGAKFGGAMGRELRETLGGGAALDGAKDVGKSLTRSVLAMGKDAGAIEELKLQPVSVDPFNFLQKWEAATRREGAHLLRQLAKTKEFASQAENEQAKFETTEDPYLILTRDPKVKFLKEPMSTDKQSYSKALWEQWLGEYGYEFIDEHWETDIDGNSRFQEAMVSTGVSRGGKLEDAIMAAAADMGMGAGEAKAWYEKARQPALDRAKSQLAERQAGQEPTPHTPGQPEAPRPPAQP